MENENLYPETTGLEIAVIGMAGRFPAAKNIKEFWEYLKNGVELISYFSDEELLAQNVDSQLLENNNYVKAKGAIDDVEYFDASFFGYTPRDAYIMDPQSRFFFECSWEALEDAGYDPGNYDGLIGLFAGAAENIFWRAKMFLSPSINTDQFARSFLNNKEYVGLLVSYKLGLRGPCSMIYTACSTSLIAIHIACQALLNGECDMVITGGVRIALPNQYGYLYQPGMISSPDGHCRAFDANAGGPVSGNGVGVVILKRLEEAIEDNDHIYAVIKGSAMNNDGLRKVGFSAPSIEGQTEVIRTALHMARVEPESITYVEAHGTGTELGDPVEIEGLKAAFNTDKKSFCAVGAVKSNVGHLDTAAGVTGFIKTVLALKNKLIPPSLHFEKPNSKLDIENSPFYVNTQLKEWKNDNYPLRAGVSSFGIGGTNAHVVLEEWPENDSSETRTAEGSENRLILLSARTKAALDKMAGNLADYLKENPNINPADLAYTLQAGRKTFRYGSILVGSTTAEISESLAQNSKKKKTFVIEGETPQIIFVFDGQGFQYVNMGLELYRKVPVFREELDLCFEILTPLMECDLKEILYPGPTENEIKQFQLNMEKINRTEIAQPLVFAFEYALAKLLMKWGIEPKAMVGYSLGEYVAACISGVFSLEEALKLVVLRGRLIDETPDGAVLSVPLSEEEIKPLLKEDISLAIVNGPSCIVAGPAAAIETFAREMREQRTIFCTPLNVSNASHSPLMASIREKFEHQFASITLDKPRIGIPYMSNVSGRWATSEQAVTPEYWGEHLCSTVRFSEGISLLLEADNTVCLEIGAGGGVSNIIQKHPDKKDGQKVLNLVRHLLERVPDVHYLLNKIGELWCYGVPIRWQALYGEEKPRRISLPTYPFQRQRYWIDENFPTIVNQYPAQQEMAESPADESPVDVEIEEYGYECEEEEYEAPRDELEENIARVWQDILGFKRIGIHTNLFDINGDSIIATQLTARLQQIYGIELSIRQLLENPTIACTAEAIKELLVEKVSELSEEELARLESLEN